MWLVLSILAVDMGGLPNVKGGEDLSGGDLGGGGGGSLVVSGPVTWAKTYITTQRDEIWFLAPNHHAATDMDNDGDVDIVFVALSSGEPWWGQVYIAYQDAWPNFTVQAVSPEVRTPYALDVDDKNGDGLKDILFAAARYDEEEDSWGDTEYYGHPFWLIAPSWSMEDLGRYDFPNHCAAWDFDGDGILDAVFGDELSGVYVSLTGGGGTVQALSGYGEGVALGDFNEDGQMDIVSAGWGPIAVALNGGGGASWTTVVLNSDNTTGGHGVQVGDVNGDGHLDIFAGHKDLVLYLGDGNGNFTPVTVYPDFAWVNDIWGDGTLLLSEIEVGIADIDGDGDMDLIASTMKPNVHTIAWFDNLGGDPPTFQMYPVEPGTDQSSYGVEVVDVNNDGCVDIVAGVGADLYVWVNTDCALELEETPLPPPPLRLWARARGGQLTVWANREVSGRVRVYDATGSLVGEALLRGTEARLRPKRGQVWVVVAETEEGRYRGKLADGVASSLHEIRPPLASEAEETER